MTGIATAEPSLANEQPPTVGLLGILRILFKWSFVVAPIAAFTIWIALSQSESIEPEHSAAARVLLVGPSEVILENQETGEFTVAEVNPLNSLGGSLGTVAEVVVLALRDPTVGDQLFAEGYSTEYGIFVDTRPIIGIEATSSDRDVALGTVERITELVFVELEARQDSLNAPEDNRIAAQLISSGIDGGPSFKSRDRFRIAIAAVGFAIAGASAFFLEGIAELWRRRNRRKERQATQRALPSGAASADRLSSVRHRSADDLIASERNNLVGVLHLVSGDEDIAEDIATETCAKTNENWATIHHDDPVGWFYQTAIREASDQFDASAVEPNEDALWDAVLHLPNQTRATLALSSIGEMTTQRIARVLDLTEDEVLEHRARASDSLAIVTQESATEKKLQSREPNGAAKAKSRPQRTVKSSHKSTPNPTAKQPTPNPTAKQPTAKPKAKQ